MLIAGNFKISMAISVIKSSTIGTLPSDVQSRSFCFSPSRCTDDEIMQAIYAKNAVGIAARAVMLNKLFNAALVSELEAPELPEV